MAQDYERLARLLETTERVICGLIASNANVSFVEMKLARLEKLVSQIPISYDELYDYWSEKEVSLWIKYGTANQLPSQLSTKTIYSGATRSKHKSHFSSEDSSLNGPLLTSKSSKLNSPSAQNSIDHFGNDLLENRSMDYFSSVAFSEKFDLTEKSAYSLIEQAFAKLPSPQSHPNDLGELKYLISLVSKTNKLMRCFFRENFNQLQSNLLINCIIPKLPPQSKRIFLSRPSNYQCLDYLIRVLKSALVRCYISGNGNVPEWNSCFYCNAKEHHIWQCPDTFDPLCFKCFQTGHKGFACKSFEVVGRDVQLRRLFSLSFTEESNNPTQ